MKHFPVAHLLFKLILVIISVFLVISAYQQSHNFIKVSAIKVTNEKEIYYPVYQTIKGETFFVSCPVESPSDGIVEKLVGNFTFVSKGELIARIKSEYIYDVLAPRNGLLLWESFNKYFNSFSEIESFQGSVKLNHIPNEIKKGEIVCSVLGNDFAFIRVKKTEVPKLSRITFYVSGNSVLAERVFSSSEYVFFKASEFIKYFIYKKEFSIFKGSKKGVTLDKNVLVNNGKEKGIFIVQHNVIKFIPVEVYNLDGNKVLAVLNNDYSRSLIVVLTPHLVKEGEVFNE